MDKINQNKSSSFDICYLVGEKNKKLVQGLPFLEIKEAVLSSKYSLSLVFIGERRSKTITKKYRKKDKISNVLSFPLDENTGEIFITPSKARKEARKFKTTPHKHIGFLFIHGLLHLKGYAHGSRMNSKEQALRKKFGV